jgi:hypothetical protein
VLFDSEVAEEIMDKQCQYFDLPILFKIDQTLYFLESRAICRAGKSSTGRAPAAISAWW